MKAHQVRTRKSRDGQVLLMTTLLLIPMFGVLGLVTDLGYMHFLKMSAQTAAEVASRSAIVYFQAHVGGSNTVCGSGSGSGQVVCSTGQTWCPNVTSPSNAIEAGCVYAKQHGFTSSSTGFTSDNTAVSYEAGTIGTPPSTSGVSSATYWVTYRAYQKVPQLFSAVLGDTSGMVVARSSSAMLGAVDCIYAMNKTASSTVSVSGTANLNSACGIFDNSSSTSALSTNGCGNGGGISAPEYDVVGGVTGCTLNPTPNTGVAQISDPLAYLPVPASAPYTCTTGDTDIGRITSGTSTNPYQLYPGVYCGGIQVGKAYVNLNPGTYILVGGGLSTQNANSTIVGTGVTIYNTYGANSSSSSPRSYSPISLSGNSNVSLKAPTSGTYAGILFFEDRNASGYSDDYGGGSSAVYEGTIYALHNAITLYGNSSVNSKYTILVADTISLVGTAGINDDYSSLPNASSPVMRTVTFE